MIQVINADLDEHIAKLPVQRADYPDAVYYNVAITIQQYYHSLFYASVI